MVIALMVGVTLHLAALGSYSILTQPIVAPIDIGDPPQEWILRELPPPPPFEGSGPMEKIDFPESAIPKFGVLEAVNDWEALESSVMPTRIEKQWLVHPGEPSGTTHPGLGGFVKSVEEEIAPPIDSFRIFDSDPEAIFLAEPDYPEMARKAGFEGMLVIRVLIDREGSVREAVIMKSTGTNVGFEQAAIDAAMKSKFTPAQQNNHPVMCWSSYTVVFRLD